MSLAPYFKGQKFPASEFWMIAVAAVAGCWDVSINGLENIRKSSQIFNDDIYLPFSPLTYLCCFAKSQFVSQERDKYIEFEPATQSLYDWTCTCKTKVLPEELISRIFNLAVSGPVPVIFSFGSQRLLTNLKVKVIGNWEFKSLWIQREKS